MIIKANIKNFGDREWKEVQINLPQTEVPLESYNYDIVQFIKENTISIFVAKNNEDVFSHTFNPSHGQTYKDAFRDITNRIGYIMGEVPMLTAAP